ncbi:hypothetical protein RchiOBHm_Chr5g0066101 [Rosa chinensis]|uniref:Transmembrane protein n=1 Tax=Rosa chinensis TaxID=74649 RepID=A0A2P6QJ49_ROSCH|nr:uncharacterized protein LOC112166560 [Rosa chinensis]PRQ34189.1 hypothetical protein RchiOBHm_Chr5g0066101 [Rosa chinensis]
MGMATTSISLSPSTFPPILKPKHCQFLRTQKPNSLPLPSQTNFSTKKTSTFHNPHENINQRSTLIWRTYATSVESVASEANPIETAQEIVATTSDDGVSVTISVLLFVAFVGLSILTIGVVYLGVTDYLQKREREKLEKEEEANKKKDGKKRRLRARAGPKGFGQKVEEFEFDADD